MSTQKQMVSNLAAKVVKSPYFTSSHFPKRKRRRQEDESPHIERLLKLFVDAFPAAPAGDDLKTACNAKLDNAVAVEISRLNAGLENCFRNDLKLWRLQKSLHVRNKRIELLPLSSILSDSASTIFWFQQASRLPVGHDDDPDQRPLLVFSEPLFFFSKPLRAYFRFLDVNHLGRFEESIAKNLVEQVTAKMEALAPEKDRKAISKWIEKFELVPVRHYLPAADTYAARAIRKCFQDKFKSPPRYQEVQETSDTAVDSSNMIILGNMRNIPHLANFQRTTRELKLRLTDSGINSFGKDMPDEPGRQGYSKSRVVITNWVNESDKVLTTIASNHTRAIESAIRFLVNDTAIAPIAQSLLSRNDKMIPSRFQFGLEVSITRHDQIGQDATILALPNQEEPVVVYDAPS